LTASQEVLAVELHLCGLDAKSEAEPELVAEFNRVFAKDKPETLRWAFRMHREQSKYFPSIHEICELVGKRQKQIYLEQEADRIMAERDELEKARAAGLLVDGKQLVKAMAAIKRLPGVPKFIPGREHLGRTVSIELPALHMTPEQIMAAVEAERQNPKHQAEIEHYRNLCEGNRYEA